MTNAANHYAMLPTNNITAINMQMARAHDKDRGLQNTEPSFKLEP